MRYLIDVCVEGDGSAGDVRVSLGSGDLVRVAAKRVGVMLGYDEYETTTWRVGESGGVGTTKLLRGENAEAAGKLVDALISKAHREIRWVRDELQIG